MFKSYGTSAGEVFQVNANVNSGLNKGIMDLSAGLAEGLAKYKAEKDKLAEEAAVQDIMSKFDTQNVMGIFKQANGKNAKVAMSLANIGLAYTELINKQKKEDIAAKEKELEANTYKEHGWDILSTIVSRMKPITAPGSVVVDKQATIKKAMETQIGRIKVNSSGVDEDSRFNAAVEILGTPEYTAKDEVLFDSSEYVSDIQKNLKSKGVPATKELLKEVSDLIQRNHQDATTRAGQIESSRSTSDTNQTREDIAGMNITSREGIANKDRKVRMDKLALEIKTETNKNVLEWSKLHALEYKATLEADSKEADRKLKRDLAEAKTIEDKEEALAKFDISVNSKINALMTDRVIPGKDRRDNPIAIPIPGDKRGKAEWDVMSGLGNDVLLSMIKRTENVGAIFTILAKQQSSIYTAADEVAKSTFNEFIEKLDRELKISNDTKKLLTWGKYADWVNEAKEIKTSITPIK